MWAQGSEPSSTFVELSSVLSEMTSEQPLQVVDIEAGARGDLEPVRANNDEVRIAQHESIRTDDECHASAHATHHSAGIQTQERTDAMQLQSPYLRCT